MSKRDEHKVDQFERRSKALSMLMGQGIDTLTAKEVVIGLRVAMAKSLKILPMEWSDEKCLLALHKFRYELKLAPDDTRHESRRWLEQRGFHRFRMEPWPPEGELP
jgi:hypothetical protein